MTTSYKSFEQFSNLNSLGRFPRFIKTPILSRGNIYVNTDPSCFTGFPSTGEEGRREDRRKTKGKEKKRKRKEKNVVRRTSIGTANRRKPIEFLDKNVIHLIKEKKKRNDRSKVFNNRGEFPYEIIHIVHSLVSEHRRAWRTLASIRSFSRSCWRVDGRRETFKNWQA